MSKRTYPFQPGHPVPSRRSRSRSRLRILSKDIPYPYLVRPCGRETSFDIVDPGGRYSHKPSACEKANRSFQGKTSFNDPNQNHNHNHNYNQRNSHSHSRSHSHSHSQSRSHAYLNDDSSLENYSLRFPLSEPIRVSSESSRIPNFRSSAHRSEHSSSLDGNHSSATSPTETRGYHTSDSRGRFSTPAKGGSFSFHDGTSSKAARHGQRHIEIGPGRKFTRRQNTSSGAHTSCNDKRAFPSNCTVSLSSITNCPMSSQYGSSAYQAPSPGLASQAQAGNQTQSAIFPASRTPQPGHLRASKSSSVNNCMSFATGHDSSIQQRFLSKEQVHRRASELERCIPSSSSFDPASSSTPRAVRNVLGKQSEAAHFVKDFSDRRSIRKPLAPIDVSESPSNSSTESEYEQRSITQLPVFPSSPLHHLGEISRKMHRQSPKPHEVKYHSLNKARTPQRERFVHNATDRSSPPSSSSMIRKTGQGSSVKALPASQRKYTSRTTWEYDKDREIRKLHKMLETLQQDVYTIKAAHQAEIAEIHKRYSEATIPTSTKPTTFRRSDEDKPSIRKETARTLRGLSAIKFEEQVQMEKSKTPTRMPIQQPKSISTPRVSNVETKRNLKQQEEENQLTLDIIRQEEEELQQYIFEYYSENQRELWNSPADEWNVFKVEQEEKYLDPENHYGSDVCEEMQGSVPPSHVVSSKDWWEEEENDWAMANLIQQQDVANAHEEEAEWSKYRERLFGVRGEHQEEETDEEVRSTWYSTDALNRADGRIWSKPEEYYGQGLVMTKVKEILTQEFNRVKMLILKRVLRCHKPLVQMRLG
ncbi:uncharacterized protein IL334_002082 [Kwoniella shivajii]|uniref:Uncharacterized protein n=1 Tax=Kwoniella shivajii TaxID=564305 RepID=A0ABZ1CTQ4_9TREE|nr:hypothetical protein IL334_002082 [Kwoniella shivajii]